MVIAVDFDGTLVENKFPSIGAPRQKIVDAVKFAKEQGHTLLLWTCRAGVELDAAVNFCRDVLQIEFDKINSDSDLFLEMYSSINDADKYFNSDWIGFLSLSNRSIVFIVVELMSDNLYPCLFRLRTWL